MSESPYLVPVTEIIEREKGGDPLEDAVEHIVESELIESLPQATQEATLDLRNFHFESNEDEGSEVDEEEVKAALAALTTEDTTWFHSFGIRLDLETTMFFFNRTIALLVIVFCIYTLSGSQDCEIMSTYVPIMTAITMAILK